MQCQFMGHIILEFFKTGSNLIIKSSALFFPIFCLSTDEIWIALSCIILLDYILLDFMLLDYVFFQQIIKVVVI